MIHSPTESIFSWKGACLVGWPFVQRARILVRRVGLEAVVLVGGVCRVVVGQVVKTAVQKVSQA